ncbi:MAG: pyrroloquinoline quinone biosynthesis protein PqqB, partial [Geminicoccaceae bacterium]|nr:pyrroloquinoline quinone biosynthesis protein PqqB [Geminicoccaceae bacterium]
GGFPQWNAGGDACGRARRGDPAARPASQAGAAFSADGERWLLVNAAPDLRAQVEATPALWPKALRHSPIKAVVLTNADVDAVAGLLHLREGTPFALHAHARVLETLDANPIFEVVDRAVVPRLRIEPDVPFLPADAAGEPLGLAVTPFLAPGKVPLYREGQGAFATDARDGDTLGLVVEHGGRRAVWLANCAAVDDDVRERVGGADLLFMDGTLWRDDEMIAQGVGRKTGRRMGHVSMDGEDGVMARLEGVPVGRRLFVHVNNTNPAHLADGPERAELERRGWEMAFDGLEIAL